MKKYERHRKSADLLFMLFINMRRGGGAIEHCQNKEPVFWYLLEKLLSMLVYGLRFFFVAALVNDGFEWTLLMCINQISN